ncbi:MAG: tyrosine--tRNA ligase, partial [Candidatus Omnitrophica bacterium]|nr:tyrosine--tRNA ligase [Candidatus Omnitrophota bacterium]
TAPDIHLGHSVLLRKMRQFQDLGHEVYFLIGDFTGQIGDPSGRSETRKQLSKKEVLQNALTYKKQVSKLLDLKKLKIVFNSQWFDKMSGLEFGKLLTHYTTNRLLERDDFTLRMSKRKPIYLSEFLYPILQAYDSVMLNADVELGGTDQKFNLIVGRELQKAFNQEPQVVITMPLLEGTDGIQKMSKSYGNYIGITEPPQEMFGKIMSISDTLMLKYYELLTDEDLSKIKKMHPKEAKLKLAQDIVAQYHSQKIAIDARREFERIFSHKEIPLNIPEKKITGGQNILSILLNSGLVKSGNEARRLIKQGGVFFDNLKVEKEDFIPQKSGVIKVGPRRFLKIII